MLPPVGLISPYISSNAGNRHPQTTYEEQHHFTLAALANRSTSDMAEKYNLSIDQGSTFLQTFSIVHQTTGNPFDFTGYTIASHIRALPTDTLPAAIFTASIDSPPTSGSFTLQLSPSGSMALTGSCYVYDVELTSGPTVTRMVEGKVTISPEVTR